MLLTDGRQVRLIGINAPEFGKEGKADQPLARAARDKANLLTQNQTLRLVFDQERQDRYGRLLAYAFLADGHDLQEILLRDGLAWFVAISPNIAHLSRYQVAESEARQAKRGVWNHPEYEPTAAERVPREWRGFLRIVGTVTTVRTKSNMVELQLAPHVQLRMTPAVSASFARSPQALRGKRILARGWFAEYKGGIRMHITHSAMMEVLP